MTDDEPGTVIVTRNDDELGTVIVTRNFETGAVTAKWDGPDKIEISPRFLDASDPAYVKISVDVIEICQFKLRVIGRRENGTLIAVRIYDIN